MTAIVNKVLSMDDLVGAGTDSYIDDIVVNEEVVSVSRVMALLNKYGLQCKPPVALENARVLGLRMDKRGDVIAWRRDNRIDAPLGGMTKRQLFSFCGKLVGHFPVASWLRPACSYVKHRAGDGAWDEEVDPEVFHLVEDLWRRVQASDPVGGCWAVDNCRKAVVWCDASNIAVGVRLKMDGSAIEDACWLQKQKDVMHAHSWTLCSRASIWRW